MKDHTGVCMYTGPQTHKMVNVLINGLPMGQTENEFPTLKWPLTEAKTPDEINDKISLIIVGSSRTCN